MSVTDLAPKEEEEEESSLQGKSRGKIKNSQHHSFQDQDTTLKPFKGTKGGNNNNYDYAMKVHHPFCEREVT